MIARLEGILYSKTPTRVILDVEGVGYEVHIPLSSFTDLPEEGARAALHIYTHLRDSALELYGFGSLAEYEVFRLLLRANRIGPKLAQTILSGVDAGMLREGLANGDVALLQSVPGIGPKTASRLAVELRERAGDLLVHRKDRTDSNVQVKDGAREQLLSALVNLQVPRLQAERVVEEVVGDCGSDASIETLVREALPRLTR